MRILVACEESQAVTIAFRNRGHEAYSCDTEPCSGGHPEWHFQQDVIPLLSGEWDMIIAFPPCTYLTNAAAVRLRVNGELNKERLENAKKAKDFFMMFYNNPCKKIAIENPTPSKIHGLPPYNHVIQPFDFGHKYSKRTCLWLKGLPPLMATKIYSDHEPYVNGGCKDANGNYRKAQGRNERDPKTRSKTFHGIAEAMADQWG